MSYSTKLYNRLMPYKPNRKRDSDIGEAVGIAVTTG